MKTFKKLGVISLVITLFTLTSCKNELEINGPLSEKLAVYGLINWTDTAHYLKIYKTFLTDENIYVAAQNLDNYLMYDSLEVLLIENDNGTLKYHLFDTTTIIPKDSGIFTNPTYPNRQIVYMNKDQLNPKSFYELQIRNKYTGRIKASCGCSSNCSDIEKLNLPYPEKYGTTSYNPSNPLNASKQLSCATFDGSFITSSKFTFYGPIKNAFRFEAYYHFYYWEKTMGSSDSTLKGPIKIDVGTVSLATDDISRIEIQWNPSTFFNRIKNGIKTTNENTVRGIGPIHLYIWAAGKEYSDFIANNGQSSLSIIEDHPSTSNIANGVGLFSSRYVSVKTDCEPTAATKKVLLTSPDYQSLHFSF